MASAAAAAASADAEASEATGPGAVEAFLDRLATTAQRQLDRTTIYVKGRWVLFGVLLVTFCLRVYFLAGYYIVAYALGILLLQQIIGFLSPAVDPDEDLALPTREKEEFRPFSRKLPEFKFWRNSFFAVSGALLMTCFAVFDLPVFWPILLAYFLQLVVITMKERIRHMIKHKYVPVSFGKQTYGDLTKVKVGAAAEKDGK